MTQQEKGRFAQIGKEIGELVEEKNAAYGNSFGKVAEFLKILWPDGIPVEAYTDALCTVRMFDKLMRIANKKDAFGESPYRDIAGYSILGVEKDERDSSSSTKTASQSEAKTTEEFREFIQRKKESEESDLYLMSHPSIPGGASIFVKDEEVEKAFKNALDEETKAAAAANEKYKKLHDVLVDLSSTYARVCVKITGPLGETTQDLTRNIFGRIANISYGPYNSYVEVDRGWTGHAIAKIKFSEILQIHRMAGHLTGNATDSKLVWESEDYKQQVASANNPTTLTQEKLVEALNDPTTALWAQVQQAMDDQGVERLDQLTDDLMPSANSAAPSLPKSIEDKALEIQDWLDANVQNPTDDEIYVWQTLPYGIDHTVKKSGILAIGDIVRLINSTKYKSYEWEVLAVQDPIISLRDCSSAGQNLITVNLVEHKVQKRVKVTFNSPKDKKNWYEIVQTSKASPDQVVDKLIDMYKLQTEETVLAKAKEQNHNITATVDNDDQDGAVCSDHD